MVSSITGPLTPAGEGSIERLWMNVLVVWRLNSLPSASQKNLSPWLYYAAKNTCCMCYGSEFPDQFWHREKTQGRDDRKIFESFSDDGCQNAFLFGPSNFCNLGYIMQKLCVKYVWTNVFRGWIVASQCTMKPEPDDQNEAWISKFKQSVQKKVSAWMSQGRKLKFRSAGDRLWHHVWSGVEVSGYPKRTGMKIWRVKSVHASSAHPKRAETKTFGVHGEAACSSKENWDGNQHPVKIPEKKENEETLQRTLEELRGDEADLQGTFNSQKSQIPVFRLSALCYFWENDFGSWRLTVGVVVGLVVAAIIILTSLFTSARSQCIILPCIRRINILKYFPRIEENLLEQPRGWRLYMLASYCLTTWAPSRTGFWLADEK